MPQRKKPTALRLIEGNPGKRKIEQNEPKPASEFPRMPPGLDPVEKKEWRRLAKELPKVPGLVCLLDVHNLHAYVQVYAQWIHVSAILRDIAGNDPATRGYLIKTANGKAVTSNPLYRQQRQLRAEMLKLGAEFGFSPVARSRIVLPEGRDANPNDDEWDDF